MTRRLIGPVVAPHGTVVVIGLSVDDTNVAGAPPISDARHGRGVEVGPGEGHRRFRVHRYSGDTPVTSVGPRTPAVPSRAPRPRRVRMPTRSRGLRLSCSGTSKRVPPFWRREWFDGRHVPSSRRPFDGFVPWRLRTTLPNRREVGPWPPLRGRTPVGSLGADLPICSVHGDPATCRERRPSR